MLDRKALDALTIVGMQTMIQGTIVNRVTQTYQLEIMGIRFEYSEAKVYKKLPNVGRVDVVIRAYHGNSWVARVTCPVRVARDAFINTWQDGRRLITPVDMSDSEFRWGNNLHQIIEKEFLGDHDAFVNEMVIIAMLGSSQDDWSDASELLK